MRISRIKETCIYSRNLEKALAFYHSVLGLEVIQHLPEKHLFLRAGDSVLLVFNPEDSRSKASPPPHYAEGKQHFAFEVGPNDYEKSKEEIIRKGIKIIQEVTWKAGVKSFYFEDPDGHVVEILPDKGVWD
jgi:catechol 2,3-dioxygenase-like lactoylglutathione lyase family enzyme